MASTPLAGLLTEVPVLSDPKQPHTYAAQVDTVVGTWNIVSAEYLDLLGEEAGKIDKDCSITVEFDGKRDKFETKMTKDPLFDFLKQHGWKPKSSLFNH